MDHCSVLMSSIFGCRYEAVFYSALAVVLMSWILFENASHHSSKAKDSSLSEQNTEEHVTIGSEERYLQLSDVRIPLIFVSHRLSCPSSFCYIGTNIAGI